MDIDNLIQIIIGCAYTVHNELGTGYLEKVYENALRLELTAKGIDVLQQHPIPVKYRDEVVGEYFADLMIGRILIIELKAGAGIAKEHEVQLVHYLKSTGIDHGLLINFGSSVTIKRKYRIFKNV